MNVNVTITNHAGEVRTQEITTHRIEGDPIEYAGMISPYTRILVYNPLFPTSRGLAEWFHVPVGGRLEIAAID